MEIEKRRKNGEKREKKKGTKAPSAGQKDERKSDQREK